MILGLGKSTGMRFRLALSALSVFAVGSMLLNPLSAVAQEDSLANVIERCEASVVRIEVKGYAGEGLGSGFVVAENGLVVTNVHVLAGAKTAVAIFPNGKRHAIVGTFVIDEGCLLYTSPSPRDRG